jgi:hypothetical protein
MPVRISPTDIGSDFLWGRKQKGRKLLLKLFGFLWE